MQATRRTSPAPVADDDYTSEVALRHLFKEPQPLSTGDPRLQSLVRSLITTDGTLGAISRLRAVYAETAMESLQSWMDEFPEHPKRYKILQALVKIAVAQPRAPVYLYVRGLTMTKQQRCERFASGGFGDIYEGVFKDKSVAVKQLVKHGVSPTTEGVKQACREAVAWRQLNHPNVLKFIGLTSEAFIEELPSLISPLMDTNLLKYSNSPTLSNDARMRLLLESITGLEYIHSQHLVHGDVRAENILVDHEGHAVLADFGLIGISNATGAKLVTHTNHSGCTKFMAPELIRARRGDAQRTPETDAYSLGSVCLQVYTGFPQHPDDTEAYAAIHIQDGTPTPPPKSFIGPAMPDIWWEVTQRCLSTQACHRPSMRNILDVMSILGFKCETRKPRRLRRLAIPRMGDLEHPFQLTITESYTPSKEEANGLAVSKGDVVHVVRRHSTTYKVVDDYGNEGRIPISCCAQPFEAKAVDSFTYESSKFKHESDHIPLTKSETVEVLRVWDRWWMVRKADGTTGSVPANKLRFTPACNTRLTSKARALYTYVAPQLEGSAHLLSFSQGDEFSVEAPAGSWRLARPAAGGPLGLIPEAYIEYLS